MKVRRLHLHSLIEKEGDLYSALCFGLNVASFSLAVKKVRRGSIVYTDEFNIRIKLT